MADDNFNYLEFNAHGGNARKLVNAFRRFFPTSIAAMRVEPISPSARIYIDRVHLDDLNLVERSFIDGFLAGMNKDDYT